MDSAQKPLQLILARNLLTGLSTPAFLAAEDGSLVFYNEAAGALLGLSFEESGKMEPEKWSAMVGPFDDAGTPIPVDDLPVTKALRDGRPFHALHRVRSTGGEEHEVEVSAIPIMTDEGRQGAMVIFWPTDGKVETA